MIEVGREASDEDLGLRWPESDQTNESGDSQPRFGERFRISPPPRPPNIYADFLNKHHREGIQHIGMPVEDLARSVAAYKKLGYDVHQSAA